MKHAVEMGSHAMIYIPNFIKIGSAIQKFITGGTQTAWRSHTPTFIFFKIRKVGYFPCAGGLVYLLRSAASRRRRRKRYPVPGGVNGPPCHWGT
jgi:hypothetical protein